MKKKNDLIDKAEIVDDPTKRYQELRKINEEMNNLLDIEKNLNSNLEQITKNLAKEVYHDQEISKPDTVTCVKLHFEKIIKEFSIMKDLSASLREKLYSVILNISVIFFDYTHRFRQQNYSIHGTKYLMWIITLFESNIVLSGIRYLRWKVKLYVELAFLYEDHRAYKAAYKVIEQAMRKLNELKSIEEQQGTLPDYTRITLVDNFRILKNFEYKYGLLSGMYPFDAWKKKLEETFTPSEKLNRLLCAVNSISNLSNFSSIIFHEGVRFTWKAPAVLFLYDMIKTDVSNIKAGIIDHLEKGKRELEKREKIKQNAKDYLGIIEDHNTKDSQMNKIWKMSSKSVPIELHMEILKACYDCKLWKEFTDLLEAITVRVIYRNLEMPYLSELDVMVSSIPYANIPNKYEKIDIDLNINNYKAGIRKLREQGKYVGRVNKDENVMNSHRGGKDSNAKDNAKDNKNKKKNHVDDGQSENPYEKIEGLDHSYVYLLVRRSHNPSKAIINCKIIMSNDSKIKSQVGMNERAIALPIRTFEDNLYEEDTIEYADIKQKILKEKNKLTPYLVYSKTNNSLMNEEEKLSALVDVLPLISNSPFADPPLNFTKNDTELTISKSEKINYNFTHNYINICTKTDQVFHIIQRECEILKNLYELEMSYTEDKKSLSKAEQFLLLNFSVEKLEILSNTLFQSIQGPLGNYFLTERRNYLYDNCILLWKKYFKDFLIRIDYFYQIEAELEEHFKYDINEKILKLQQSIFLSLFNVHFVLSSIKTKDPIIFAYLTMRLADFAERTENISFGVEMINRSLEYLIQGRENENIFGLNNYENKHTFTTFTCDNNKISNLVTKVEGNFENYVRDLNLKRRKNYRSALGLNKLTPEEEFEEDFENCNLEKEYEKRLNTVYKKQLKKFTLSEMSEKEKMNQFITENENTLNCLFVELTMRYYRLYLKNGMIEKHMDSSNISVEAEKTNKTNTKFNSNNKSNSLNKTRMPTRILKKTDIIKGQTANYVKGNIDFLKQSLQEAGKLEPDKPLLQKYEKKMLNLISKNSYLNVLFQCSMATFRSSRQDQKYILNQSASTLSKCYSEEDSRSDYYEKYFFYIKSFEKFNKNLKQTADTFYPYNMLYKSIMIEAHEKIPEPILVHKTSTTASFIFPIVKIKTDTLDAAYKITNKVALFGQQSTGTNIVALHNKGLFGTGNVISVMDYVTVRNLKPNEKFIFAYAGFDNEEVMINGIGGTSKEVETYFPLPLHLITYHLCKISYELKHFEVCKERAKVTFNYFTERSDLKDLSLDAKTHSLLFYKLKYDYIANTSFLELEGVAFTFLFFSKSMMIIKKSDHSDDTGVNILSKQKNILKNLNVLMLGLEIACYIRHFSLIKSYVKEIYSVSSGFLKQRNLYKELTQLFIRLTIGLNLIPNELWDLTLRNLSALIEYQVLIMLVNNNEIDLYKKLLVQELGLDKKRFYLYKYKYMKKLDEGKKGGRTGDKPGDKQNKNNPMVEEEKLVEADAVLLKDIEKETAEIDEFLLYFGDFNEIVKNRVSNYIVGLDKYTAGFTSSPELTAELDKRKKELNEFIEVWDGYKNEGIKFFQKYATTARDTSEKYYEYCTKILKKIIESNFVFSPSSMVNSSQTGSKNKNKDETNTSSTPIAELLKLSDDVQIKETDITHISHIFTQKLNFLTNDVIYLMKMRIKEFLSKVEKEISNNNTGNNQNNMDEIAQAVNLEKIRMQIEEKYFGATIENEYNIPYDTMSVNDIFKMKEKYFWIGDLLFNKAVLLFSEYLQYHKNLLNFAYNNFLNNYKLVDIANLNYLDENFQELNTQNNNLEKDPVSRNKRRSKILDKLAMASLFLNEVNAYRSVDNLMYFTYNLLLYDMVTPMEVMSENQWTYLNVISEIAIKRLEKIRKGEEDFNSTDYTKEMESLKSRLEDKDHIKTGMNFNIMKRFYNDMNCRFYVDEEKLIEIYESKINFDVYVELICFTIQCTFYAKKWNVLSNLIQNFNFITNDTFCDFTLGYLIEAQKNIYEKANENTKSKQVEMNQRVALYETWKNSRKKNKRQQMITGEIPQEQIDFEKDYSILSKENFILESISNLLKADKEKSEKQYFNLVNDSNNSLKAVNSCRKLFEKYQMEASTLVKDVNTKGDSHFDVKSKSKAIKVFANNLINLYKKAIQILKKRQENYLLIQILYEMSIVYHTDGDLKNAEVYFNESLDTVFQKLYSLKDFRNLFESVKSLSEKYGIRQLLYAVVNLHKLGKYCYDTDLYWQRECAVMSAEIIYNILIAYLPNPPSMLNYGLYRINEINKNLKVFKSSENVKAEDLVTSFIETAEILISYSDFELCLPMLSLCEYLSCDIVKNVNYLHKCRILKIVCLAELGMISEAMQIYYKLIKKFDMPTFLSNSLNIEKTTGKFANLTKEFNYSNNLPPDNQKNIDAVNAFNKLFPDNDLKIQLGCTLFCELTYSKCLILNKIYEKENYSLYLDKSDLRMETLTKIEKEMRETLGLISTNEELNILYNLSKANISEVTYEFTSQLNKKVEEILNNKKITKEEYELFYLVKFNKNETELRKERIDLMCKIRLLLARVYNNQGLNLQSSGLVLRGIENLKKLCNGQVLGVELADDFTFDFKNVEISTGKGGKQAQDNKKPLTDRKGNPQNVTNANIDEEINKFTQMISQKGEGNAFRTHPNAVYWLKFQYAHLLNLSKMGRYEDCLQMSAKLLQSSKELNDTFYFMRIKEIEATIHLLSYNLPEADKIFDEISTRSKTNYIADLDYSIFLGSCAEYFYFKGNLERALSLIKDSRKMLWMKMAKINYIIPAQSYFNSKLTSLLEIDKNLKNILKEREATYGNLANTGKKGDAGGKKKDDKNEILPINFNQGIVTDVHSNLNINPNSEMFENPVKEINDSDEGFNLYFKYTDLLCRVDLRFVLFQLMNFSVDTNSKLNLEGLNSVLSDLEIMSNKMLYPHTSFRIILYFLFSKIHKLNFIYDLHDFLKEKMGKLTKKYKLEILTNSEVLNKFSNFYNERCSAVWVGYLKSAKENLENSLHLVKGEFYTFENGFNVHTLLLELADVNVLLAEFRPSLSAKYCDFNQIINKLNSLVNSYKYYDRENDDLPYLPDNDLNVDVKNDKSNWISERTKTEQLYCKNLIRAGIYYGEIANRVVSVKKMLNENIYELATVNLIDPSKLPRDVVNQILENDLLNKKRNKMYLPNITQKPTCDAFDVFNLLKNYIKEMETFTLTNEDLVKTVSKLHKYLKLNSSSYSSKIYYEILPYADISDLNAEVVKKDQIFSFWNTNLNEIINPNPTLNQNTNSYINLIYILGANSTIVDFKDYVFGRVFISKTAVVKINRSLLDLKIRLRNSLGLSEQRKQRDLKYLQVEYSDLLTDFAYEFLKTKRTFSDRLSVDKIIKKEYIGDITMENLDFWINFTNLNTYTTINQKFNAFLNEIHIKLITK